MENLAPLVFWQNKIFQTGTSLILTSLNTEKLVPCARLISLCLVSLDIQGEEYRDPKFVQLFLQSEQTSHHVHSLQCKSGNHYCNLKNNLITGSG